MFYEWIIYVLIVLLEFNGDRNRVEARHAVVPLDFSSREGLQFKYVSTIQPDYYENNRAEYSYREPKRKKLKHKKKKINKNDVQAHKKAKPKRKYGKRFVKTSLRGKDSNLSESKELEKGKPVDIIVHIKMND
ncbi:unnamed protein product [Colias eurytheme]|nr:unnamed protein product [Colias eurytheme]